MSRCGLVAQAFARLTSRQASFVGGYPEKISWFDYSNQHFCWQPNKGGESSRIQITFQLPGPAPLKTPACAPTIAAPNIAAPSKKAKKKNKTMAEKEPPNKLLYVSMVPCHFRPKARRSCR